MIRMLTAVVLAGLYIASAVAEEGRSYLNVQITSHQVEISGLEGSGGKSPEAGPTAFNIRLGGYFTERTAVEAIYAGPIGDDTFDDSEANIELRSMIGLVLNYDYVTHGPLRLFAKGGPLRTSYKGDDSFRATAQGFMFGVGMTLDVSENTRFIFEYDLLPDADVEGNDEEIEANSIGFGLIFDL